MKQWIGIDIGTQGTKGVLFDECLHPLANAFVPSRLITPGPGVVWQEPEEMLQSVVETIRQLMASPKACAKNVGAVGIDSQMAGILGIDCDGNAATVYDSWLDTRCRDFIETMRETAGEQITRITGGPVSNTHGPKMLWWMHEQPSTYRKIAKFVLPHAYTVLQLTGLRADQAYFDHTCLHYSGFGDNFKKQWSAELCGAFHLEQERLPRIVSPFDVIGGICDKAARETGLLSGTPVVAGAGDTAATVFGAGMFQAGTALDCAGTASVFSGVVNRYRPDTDHYTLSMMRSPEEALWYPLAYIGGGGMNLRWMAERICPDDGYAGLDDEAAQVPAASEGLLCVPHWAGRVLPNDPSMKGAFLGLDWKHGRGHLFRAMMEAIAYEYRFYASILRELFPSTEMTTLFAVGGGAKSPLMLQIKSSVLRMPVQTFDIHDSACIGSAAIAAHGTGNMPDYRNVISGMRHIRDTYQPSEADAIIYDKAYPAYLEALSSASSLYRSMEYKQTLKQGERPNE